MIHRRIDVDVARGSYTQERGDCTVHALAVAAGISYARAHAFLRSRGRRDRCGMRMWSYHFGNYAGSNGKFVPITSQIKMQLVYAFDPRWVTVGKVLRSGLLPPRCVLGVRGHVFAVINGVVEDTRDLNETRRRVEDIMEFKPR